MAVVETRLDFVYDGGFLLRCQNALDWVRNFVKRICVSWGELGGGKKSWKEKAAGGEAPICCSRHNCPSPLLLLLVDFFFLFIVLLVVVLLSSSVDFLPGILIWWNLELRCKRLQRECW